MRIVHPISVEAPALIMAHHVRQGRRVVMLRGDLERPTLPSLERYLQDFDRCGDLELDLDQVEFMDVAGAVLLAQTATKFAQHGGRLRLCGLSRTAARVLHLLGTDLFGDVQADDTDM